MSENNDAVEQVPTIETAVETETTLKAEQAAEPAEEISPFLTWPLSEEVRRAIVDMGYSQPTPVQAAVIPYLLENKTDLLALAKTGTGKTAAFGLPLVEKVTTEKKLQALVMCPTRELATQVAQNLQSFGRRKGLRVVTVLGGESYRRQIDALRNNPQILVSTPGRLIDLMDQGEVKLDTVDTLILDEADEMLSFGFQEALENIWENLAKNGNEYNTWLFSATMSESIKNLTRKYLKTPYEVHLNKTVEPARVDSYAAVVFEEDKEDALSLLLQNEANFYGIIFAQTKQQVANLEIRMRQLGFNVDSLHGDKAQADRTRTINRMKKREIEILVATDVAARGLDIEDLTHVVNFELPWDVETYTHRIGRTARAGKQGTVWTFVKPKESQFLRKFERALKFEFKNLVIPTVDQVRSGQIRRWLLDVTKATIAPRDEGILDRAFQQAAEQAGEGMTEIGDQTKQWLMKALAHMEIGTGINLKQPRSFELRPRDGGGRDGFAPRGDRGPRQGGFDRGPRRDFGGGGRGYDRGPRRDFGDRGPRRDFGGDRPQRSEGGFDRGPRRDFNNDRGPRRDFGGDRPQRSEGGFDRGPRREFNNDRGGDRGFAPRSDRREGGFRRDDRGGDRGFAPRQEERPRRTFNADFDDRLVTENDKPQRSEGGARPPRRGSKRSDDGKWM